jgi:hypothetical protein
VKEGEGASGSCRGNGFLHGSDGQLRCAVLFVISHDRRILHGDATSHAPSLWIVRQMRVGLQMHREIDVPEGEVFFCGRVFTICIQETLGTCVAGWR